MIGSKEHPHGFDTYAAGGHVSDTPKHPPGQGRPHKAWGCTTQRPAATLHPSPNLFAPFTVGAPSTPELRREVRGPGASRNLISRGSGFRPVSSNPTSYFSAVQLWRLGRWVASLIWLPYLEKPLSQSFCESRKYTCFALLGLSCGLHVADVLITRAGQCVSEDPLPTS